MFGFQFKAGTVKKWVYDSTGTDTSFTHTTTSTDSSTYGSYNKIGSGSGTSYVNTDEFSFIIDNTFTEFVKSGGSDATEFDETDLISSDSITKVVYLKNSNKIDEEYILTDTSNSNLRDYKKLGSLKICVKTESDHTSTVTISDFKFIFGSDVALNYNSFTNFEPTL